MLILGILTVSVFLTKYMIPVVNIMFFLQSLWFLLSILCFFYKVYDSCCQYYVFLTKYMIPVVNIMFFVLLLHIFVLHILKIIICNFIITDFMLFKNKLSRYVYLHLNSIFSSITIDTINQQRLVQLPCILPSFFSIRVIWSWFHSVSRYMQVIQCYSYNGGRRGRDRMVVWFTTTHAISTYHHWRCEFEPR